MHDSYYIKILNNFIISKVMLVTFMYRDSSGEKRPPVYIAIQNVAKIISVVEALYAILTVCLG